MIDQVNPPTQSDIPNDASAFSPSTPVREEEVAKIIRASPSKSCGLDPLPTWHIKSLDSLTAIITTMVNYSLNSDIFPIVFKSALVRPLLKKPTVEPEVLGNYRPVSNLAFISTVMEKVITAQLICHMEAHYLNENRQSAYRCHHSTETALIKAHNDLLRALDNGCRVFLVLLDLSAAFDTPDHDILLHRLDSLGVSGTVLQWMDSYLRGRSQTVVMDGVKSDPQDLQYGIPQASLLGPLLFMIYTILIGAIARLHNLEIHIYADDTQLYVFFKMKDPISQQKALCTLQSCITEIRAWMVTNKVHLNDDKTEFLAICAPRLRAGVTVSSLTVGSSHIAVSSATRNLGVFITRMLMSSVSVRQL